MEWKTMKIGDVCKIKRGASPRPIQKFMAEKGMPWVKISDATSINSRFLNCTKEYIIDEGVPKSVTVMPGTLIVSNSATPGLPKIITIKACVHDGWLIISDFNGVTRDYLYYKFVDIREQLSNQANGSVFQNLKTDIVREFPIKVPDIQTQDKIVSILSSLDDKIENNNRINRNLEAQAQALFKSWFVDFEPWGGVMPEDWREGTLGEIADITSGKRPPMREATISRDAIIPIIGAADVIGYTNDTLYETRILVTGRVGTHGVVQRFDDKCWPSDNTLVIESNWYEYTYQVMGKIDFHNMNRGSTQPLITQTDLKNQKIVIPSTKVLDDYECMVGTLFRRISNNQRESQRLAALRDTLLPKLMKGEIAV